MDALRRYALAIVFIAAAFTVAGVVWLRVPALTSHAAFLYPVIGALLVGVLIAFEPRGVSGRASSSLLRVYAHVAAAIAGLQLFQTVVHLLIGIGVPLDMLSCSAAGVGVLVTFLGTSFGKLTRNHVIGICTRYTLASDEVWSRTHRVGGRLFVLAGLLMYVIAVFGHPALSLIPLAAAALVSYLYAHHIGRRHFADQGP